ncbi:methyltransferase domain-containing protein [candidate division WOR-3 bacterium]|nr:methyltransferase domain-containing protein [candidate division WOR-3 bacterium]
MGLEKLYDPVAEFYDIEHDKMDCDISFYVEEAGKAGGKVLELGAGTGRVTQALAKAGIEVTAVEISKGMLDIARKNSKSLPSEKKELITWVQGDMRDFSFDTKFSHVLIPFRSFQHLQTRDEQQSCLDCVSRHLEKGGSLVLSLFAPSYERLAHKTMFNHLGTIELPDGKTLSRTERVTHDHVNQIVTVQWTYDVSDFNGDIKRKIWTFPMRYLWRFETELLLENAGLEVEIIYGDYRRGEFNHDGEMLFVARKH